MMKLAAWTAIGLTACSMAAAEDLRIGASADYPPWEPADAGNEIIGFDRDSGDELCRRIEANCTWINQACDGLLPALQAGKFDAVISGISITAERAKMVDFSAAYADAPNSVAGPAQPMNRLSKRILLAPRCAAATARTRSSTICLQAALMPR